MMMMNLYYKEMDRKMILIKAKLLDITNGEDIGIIIADSIMETNNLFLCGILSDKDWHASMDDYKTILNDL